MDFDEEAAWIADEEAVLEEVEDAVALAPAATTPAVALVPGGDNGWVGTSNNRKRPHTDYGSNQLV
jgi:hypothetical protein